MPLFVILVMVLAHQINIILNLHALIKKYAVSKNKQVAELYKPGPVIMQPG